MADITLADVNRFLSVFKVKAEIYGIKYRDDRTKNRDSLMQLGITAIIREKIVLSVKAIDYSDGPLPNTLNEDGDLWVFGKDYRGVELYIKISLGTDGAVCVSFHEAEHKMIYPFKHQ